MSQAHLDFIGDTFVLPGKWDVLALPDEATFYPPESYDNTVFGDNVPDTLSAEHPVLYHGGDIYVYAAAGNSAVYFKLAVNAPDGLRHLPSAEALKAALRQAEVEDMAVGSVASCLHYLCENSFGFSTTHPRYSEETWLKPIENDTEAYHGPEAKKTLDTVCAMVGMQSYDGYFPDGFEIPLLQLAQVQSEYHRNVRSM